MLKVKLFDVDFGEAHVILNYDDAREFGLRPQDRIKIANHHGSTVAIVNITDAFVKKGVIGVFSKIRKELGLKNSDTVNIELVGIPLTVELIKKKTIRPAMNYPYDLLLKRIASAEKIDFTDFLTEIGHKTSEEMENLINRFDSNSDAEDKIRQYI